MAFVMPVLAEYLRKRLCLYKLINPFNYQLL